MAGIANMDSKEVVLTGCRMTWDEFATIVSGLGNFLCRGDIPVEERQKYQEAAAALHAAAPAIVFIGQEFEAISRRSMAECEAWQKNHPKAPPKEEKIKEEKEVQDGEPVTSDAA